MSRRDNHTESSLDPRVIDYFYGEMSSSDVERFRVELASSPELARQLQQLQILRQLTEENPCPEPGADLVSSIVQAAHKRDSVTGDLGRQPRQGLSRWPSFFQLTFPRLATAMALVLVAVVGIYVASSARKASRQAPVELSMEKQLPSRAWSAPPSPEPGGSAAGLNASKGPEAESAASTALTVSMIEALALAEAESGVPEGESAEPLVEASLAEAPDPPTATDGPHMGNRVAADAQTGSPVGPQVGDHPPQESPPSPRAVVDCPEMSEVSGEMDAAKNRRRGVVGTESGGGLGVGGGGSGGAAKPDRGLSARERSREREGRRAKDTKRSADSASPTPSSALAAEGIGDTDDTVFYAPSKGLTDSSVVQAERENAVGEERVQPTYTGLQSPSSDRAEESAGGIPVSTEALHERPPQDSVPVRTTQVAAADTGRDGSSKKKESPPDAGPSKTLAMECPSEKEAVAVPAGSVTYGAAADCGEIWKSIESARSTEQAGIALNLVPEFENGSCASRQSSAVVAMAKARLLLILGRTSEARRVLQQHVDDPVHSTEVQKLLEKIPE